MRTLLHALIPRDWTGEQALFAARLLRAALDSVWEVHGEAMAAALGDVPFHRWFDALPDDGIHDEDIPF